LATAPNTAIVASIGLASGRMILENTCIVEAPSIVALSSRECGIDSI
jgi:hypothetical protein